MLGPLQFTPLFMERVWGGDKLARYLSDPVPREGVIGEAWLVSDHPSGQTVVSRGPYAERTLASLLDEFEGEILGRIAKRTPHGRFPLLLKILDAGAPLSVQVHPDDACAERLGEPDVGKTEMWHVIEAEAGSELVCGLDPGLKAEAFRSVVERGAIEQAMARFDARPGDSVFVSAGTVHAIGAGILLAEIQQNSDLTYRIYDYNRSGVDGKPRELHLDKAVEAINFGSSHRGKNDALSVHATDQSRRLLAVSKYFAAERWDLNGPHKRDTRGDSFHIVLAIDGPVRLMAGGSTSELQAGQAALAPASSGEYTVAGDTSVLVYYVPDLAADVIEPLRAAGHADEAIVRLGGDPSTSDLVAALQ